jgi:hypothetical protein
MDSFKLHPASANDHNSSSPTHVGGFRPESSSNKKKGTKSSTDQKYIPPHKIGNKNETEIRPVEWQTYYEDADSVFKKQCDVVNKLNDDYLRRQQRYMKREQEYRKYIEDLQRELRIRKGYEVDAHKKNKKVIDALKNELNANIEGIQDKIKDLKEEQEKDIVRKFSTDLNKLKSEIENSKTAKGDNMENVENNQQLETITNVAQRIENENRTLMKKNSELKKEYQSQENDKELLLKQLVMLKKENSKIKEEVDFYNKIIEEKDPRDINGNIDIPDSPDKHRTDEKSSKGHSRTLLGSRANQKRGEGMNVPGSMRQSAQTFNMDPEFVAQTYMQKPPETEEEKVKRYERIIEKLKKTLDNERKFLKGARTQYQSEMQYKTELEDMLKECVYQVKSEIMHRNQDPKASAINNIQKKGKKLNSINDVEFTQQDRERVIELLLSQEKVLYLLYEKTFPNEEGDEHRMPDDPDADELAQDSQNQDIDDPNYNPHYAEQEPVINDENVST